MEARFKDLFYATLAEQQQSGRLMFPVSQEVGLQQMVVMPPPVLGQASSACAQSSVASTTAQQYPVDTIMTITPCLLLYPVGRAGKTKEVAKAQVHPARGLFEGKPIPIGYACVQVEQLLKSSYEDNEIDFPTADGKSFLGECVGTTILWHKRDILLVDQVPLSTQALPSTEPREASPAAPFSREPTPQAHPSPAAPISQHSSPQELPPPSPPL